MTPETISAMAGALLSLLLNYVPGLNAAFDRMPADRQRAAMAFLLAVVAVGLVAWACTDTTASGTAACATGSVWRQAAQAFVFALMANQAADRISPKPREPQ